MTKNMDDMQQLIFDNIGLAYFFARKYTFSGLDFKDLKQEACVGLCRAAYSFNPNSGKFGTYAALWIRSQIRNYITKQKNYYSRAQVYDETSDKYAIDKEPAISQNQVNMLSNLFEDLNEREKIILYRRIIGNDTLDAIGQTYGISRERVRQLEKRALQKLEMGFNEVKEKSKEKKL